MNLTGITINHTSAPLELREALHLSRDEIIELIPKLKRGLFTDGFVLSTCNRTEIFGFPQNDSINYKEIIELLGNHKSVPGIIPEHFKKFFSCGAVKHIFSVASGIDSLMIGDSQILGQVKEAFEISEDMDFAGSIFRRLFDSTLKVGKRVIKETNIGEGAVSISYAAVQIVEKIFAALDKKSALIIGAGETGELAALHLKDKEIGQIIITNRNPERAQKLAEKIAGDIIPFLQFKEYLHNFDIIISATSSERILISKEDVAASMKKRRGTPICLMDIAVPRDIDPGVKQLENVFYNDIDSLQIIVEQNLKKRGKEIPLAEKIIMEELVNFFSWYNTLEVVPTIKSIRDFFEEIRMDELEKIRHKVNEENYHKLEDMTRRLIGRLLHNPTVKLRHLAESGTNIQEVAATALLLKELFDLDNIPKNGKPD